MIHCLTTLFWALAWLFPALASGEEIRLEVPFVPTPHEVVAEMIRMANVDTNDVVYDLGCGDGRIVIAAARERKARGVGIDKDPRRIEESMVNARIAGVERQVRFVEHDIFDADIRDATVVTMYLLQSVNLRLIPKFLRELRPGARIVSHNYDLRRWKPDRALALGGHSIYCWIVPANVSGVWTWKEGDSGSRNCLLRLNQRFQEIGGEVRIGNTRIPLSQAVLHGGKLRIAYEMNEGQRRVICHIDAEVAGDSAEGSMELLINNKPMLRPWKATRDPATVSSITGTEDACD